MAPGDRNVMALTPALASVTGVVALVAGLLRLGFIANFISEPVLKGFIVGLALTIIVGQVPKLFGVEKGEGDFFEQLWDLLGQLGDTQGHPGRRRCSSLAIVIGLRRVAPAVPGSLVAVIFGVVVVELFDLDARASTSSARSTAACRRSACRTRPRRDYLRPRRRRAVGIMLVGFAEGLGAAKTYAARDHYEIDTNRELVGLGRRQPRRRPGAAGWSSTAACPRPP